MTDAPDEICRALTAMLQERTEWDEPPGLYLLYRKGWGIEASTESVIPLWAWDSVPTHTLAFFAQSIERIPEMLAAAVPADLIGAVFRCEMWGVKTAEADEAGVARMRELHRARRLSEHPERIEQRCAWAVTRHGAHYMATQHRGETEIEVHPVEKVHGLIPDSLAKIMHAFAAGAN